MIRSLLLVFSIATLAIGSAPANTVTFLGNTTGQSTFNRPTETGARSSIGSAVPFFAYRIDVLTGGLFNFSLNAANPASYDTFLHIFSDAFDPKNTSDPAANFLAANDDLIFGNSLSGSGLTNLSLMTGKSYFMVIDGFGNSDFGAYSTTISSTNGFFRAAAVPEGGPGLVLAGLALGSVMVIRRRLLVAAL